MSISGECPICDASIVPEERVEESEVLSCPDCQSMLVVDRVHNLALVLQQAPQIEEDWGE